MVHAITISLGVLIGILILVLAFVGFFGILFFILFQMGLITKKQKTDEEVPE